MRSIEKFLAICLCLAVLTNGFFPPGAAGITIKEEEELSREFMKVVLTHFPLIEDSIIVDYVNRIGKKIVSRLPRQPFNYRFYVLKDDTYNAFASPAGHIFINSGLLMAMEREEELAGIVSHEVAHVYARHISQKIDRSQKIGMATLAGIALGVFLGTGGASTAANAVTMGSIAAGQSLALAYSREDESEADRVGLDILNQSGYSAEGLLIILKKIRGRQWFGSDQVPTYLQTHPATEDRMAYIDTWIERQEKKPERVDSYDFDRSRVWLFAVHGDESAALNRFSAEVNNDPENPLWHYGYGLALARTGNRSEAVDHLKKALEKRAFDAYILKDLGRVYYLDGRYSEALSILVASGGAAADPEGLFYLGRTQMEMDRLKDAAATFEKLIAAHPDYSQAYYSLGQVCGRLGRMSDAHYNLGVYYQRTSSFKNAVFHLKKALETTQDPEKKAKIEEMLGGAQAEEKKEKKKNQGELRSK